MENSIMSGPKIGMGIYTPPDIAKILKIKQAKVRRWVEYWNKRLDDEEASSTWQIGNSKAVNFYVLVELNILDQIQNNYNFDTKRILNARDSLSKLHSIEFPFAHKNILENLHVFGRELITYADNKILTLDNKFQYILEFAKSYIVKINFDNNSMASVFYPLGRNKAIEVDPGRQFGYPVISGTNIIPDTVYKLYQAGETKETIAYLYDLTIKQIDDAIEFSAA